MAGLVKIAAPPKFVCCVREQMLREHTLHQRKAGLSCIFPIQARRSEGRFFLDQPFVDHAPKVPEEPNVCTGCCLQVRYWRG